MYINSGYLNNSRLPFVDKTQPLIVGSCGEYRLMTKEKLPTWSPKGRVDYQLLYVASGKAHFILKGKERIVNAGHMVLYMPKQEQHYEYFATDKPEVYWVHFTGSEVKQILRHFEIPMDENVFYSGVSSAYRDLFQRMIEELQACRVGYRELLEMYLRQIFLIIQRTRSERKPAISTFLQEEMDYARRYFHENYSMQISIEEFAHSRHMSVSWFLRKFKELTGISPMQYILSIRLNNAQSLLETTDYNVTEISSIVGYDNPLYFSRLFKKQKGVSPSEYRKIFRNEENIKC